MKRGKGERVLLDRTETTRGELNQLPGFRNIVGRCPGLLKVLELSARVANRQTPVLIIGETGTGKDLLARAIHQNSRARDGSFTKITCGMLSSGSENPLLHGPAPGPLSTLYLDEVTELPPHVQVELTHLLHDPEDGRGEDTHRSGIRVIASTSLHGNLVNEAKLRADLYYRLSVLPLHLPPLRDRKEDLPELVDFLADRLSKRHGVNETSIASAVRERFTRYHWPGNVRELENVVERMLLLAADFEFSEQERSVDLLVTGETSRGSFSVGLPENGVSLAKIERDLLVAALAKFGGNQTKAARYLNISRRTLIYRMGKYSLRTVNSTEHN
ncbi:MAG: sigma 54-interacting transcriptional regulator [Bryobacteraceae bacterium]